MHQMSLLTPEPEVRSLDEIQNECQGCQNCPLAKTRNRIVFGQGNPKAKVMLIGEGPGYHEDKSGFAFVGRAGKLLTEIFSEIGIARREVYITNVLKCRPPANRNPEGTEAEACRPWLEGQIRAIRPRILIALGRAAAGWLGIPGGITSLREGPQDSSIDIPVIVTWHPAAALRDPDSKKRSELKEDIQMAIDLTANLP